MIQQYPLLGEQPVAVRPGSSVLDYRVAEFRNRFPDRPPAKLRRFLRRKKQFDLMVASVVVVPAVVVVLTAMLLVRLTSKGPSLYSQKRVGRYGRVFTIWKIRSMYHNCEGHTGPQWSTPGDPRVTRLGKILRQLHIDELPQLWNVFRGEMSLIGPRPERPEIVEDLRLSIFGYDVRHQVKPGITGFAQIHLPPDSNILTVHNKLVYDRYYISRMGLRLDLRILAATALKVVGLRKLYQRPPRNRAGV